MDNSEEYVKMCEKAEEIQALWEFGEGSFYQARFDESDGKRFEGKTVITVLCDSCNVIDSYGSTTVSEYSRKGKYIWLPRQDELQQMLAHLEECSALLINRFKKFLDPMLSARKFYWSMEQLWLAFAMLELYHKKWDGEEWV